MLMSAHFRGGMVRFSAGLRPLRRALRAWMMKCRTGDEDDTTSTNLSARGIRMHTRQGRERIETLRTWG